jgi:ESX secretion-associated protein EspG
VVRPNAVELTAGQAWFLAEALGAGSLPWVLAITPPYSEPAAGAAFRADRIAELTAMGVTTSGASVNPAVAQWLQLTCRAAQWLELRFVSVGVDVLRGFVARRGARTVVALRNAQLVTFSEVDVLHPAALVPVLTAALSGRRPAQFDEFILPATAGARADEQIRGGAELTEVLDFLGIPASARPLIHEVFHGRRSYVEIVAGEHRDGQRVATDVGVSIVDTALGRILISPSKAYDGEWISTFEPGQPDSIARAVQRLTAALPGGGWFPGAHLTRDFEERTEQPCPSTV